MPRHRDACEAELRIPRADLAQTGRATRRNRSDRECGPRELPQGIHFKYSAGFSRRRRVDLWPWMAPIIGELPTGSWLGSDPRQVDAP
jgi:hypothetical protein